VILLGCDPGLATFGAVLLFAAPDPDRVRGCLDADVFTSEPSPKKRRVTVADDRVRRARELWRWLDAFVGDRLVGVCAAEEMSFPRGARAIASIALGWGVLSAWLEDRRVPVVAAHPKTWRKALCRSGREDDAHGAAVDLVPTFAGAHALSTSRVVHALDALGVACWSLSTDVVRASMRGRAA